MHRYLLALDVAIANATLKLSDSFTKLGFAALTLMVGVLHAVTCRSATYLLGEAAGTSNEQPSSHSTCCGAEPPSGNMPSIAALRALQPNRKSPSADAFQLLQLEQTAPVQCVLTFVRASSTDVAVVAGLMSLNSAFRMPFE